MRFCLTYVLWRVFFFKNMENSKRFHVIQILGRQFPFICKHLALLELQNSVVFEFISCKLVHGLYLCLRLRHLLHFELVTLLQINVVFSVIKPGLEITGVYYSELFELIVLKNKQKHFFGFQSSRKMNNLKSLFSGESVSNTSENVFQEDRISGMQ